MSVPVETRARIDETRVDAFPVIEIFGPTVQGEGPDAGRPAYFVRFGGCDYRCAWCDSMYAVEPSEIRTNAKRLTTRDIVDRLSQLPEGPTLVVLSGGNPALLELETLVGDLHALGHEVAVETQGSRWRDWLGGVNRLVVSPKPPSSGMATSSHRDEFHAFMEAASTGSAEVALKIVVFDEADLNWAQAVHTEFRDTPCFLSVGTDQNLSEQETSEGLASRFRWLAESVASRPELALTRVLPQLHVVAWGTARGV